MSILSDQEFNEIFPFKTPRHNQRQIIEQIIECFLKGKRYVILNAPTGVGKSAIGYSVARYFGKSYVLTSQKVLQEQYYKDFSIPYVLGRVNYKCQKNPAMTCELGACFNSPKNRCTKTVNGVKLISCPYIVARTNCINASHSNLNYSYFLSLLGNSNTDEEKDIIICDECHNLPAELINQCTVKLNENLMKLLGLISTKLPDITLSDGLKCNWLFNDLFENIKSEFLYLMSQMQHLNGLKSTREYKKISIRYTNMHRLLETIKMMKSLFEEGEKVIVTQNNDAIEFKLLHCNTLFNYLMNKGEQKFLFMSASILDYKTFVKELGIDESLTEYIECDSVFPVENRMIYYTPVGSMSYKTKGTTLPLMIKRIEKILKEHKNVKGIIHTVNYDVAERIIEGLTFSDQSTRLLMPKGTNKQILLDAFYTSDKPYVLISPSLTEGIDLKEDLSRFCIICKVPYASLADKWTVTRMKEDNQWYTSQACMHLIQMTGRSIRSETDYATTYILDSDFMKLAENSIDIFPKWWKDAVVIV